MLWHIYWQVFATPLNRVQTSPAQLDQYSQNKYYQFNPTDLAGVRQEAKQQMSTQPQFNPNTPPQFNPNTQPQHLQHQQTNFNLAPSQSTLHSQTTNQPQNLVQAMSNISVSPPYLQHHNPNNPSNPSSSSNPSDPNSPMGELHQPNAQNYLQLHQNYMLMQSPSYVPPPAQSGSSTNTITPDFDPSFDGPH